MEAPILRGIHRRLVPRSDVRRALNAGEELVHSGEELVADHGQIITLSGGQLSEIRHRSLGHHHDLQRPFRCSGCEHHEVVCLLDDAGGGGEFGGQEIVEKRCAMRCTMSLCLARDGGHAGWHERVRVNLPVRVVQGHADFLAAVLKREHGLDRFEGGEFGGAVRPDVDERALAAKRQVLEGAFCVRREAHNFAA